MDLIVLLLRVAIGGVLIAAGALKAGHVDVLAANITAYRILPVAVVAPLAILLPFFEIVLGGYLLVGYFTRAAAWVATAQFVLFGIAIASLVVRGIPAACGCFGPGDTSPASWYEVGRDAILAALAVGIALGAPGTMSLDRRMLSNG